MPQTVNAVVLIVEDEALIRMNAADRITQAGWQPLEAADAEEALTILARDSSVTVLFTDINMPGSMNGLELVERAYLSRPEIQIIITSGKEIVPRERMPMNGTFLAKPYDLDDLVNIVGARHS